jgi:ArsR family transcriptional regulator
MRLCEYIRGYASCVIFVNTHMKRSLADMETVFKALADTTRLRILGLLLAGEVCVCHIHDALDIPQPKTSRHLAYLRRSGLVAARREGKWMHYRLADVSDPVQAALRETVMGLLQHQRVIQRDLTRLEKATGCCVSLGPQATPARSEIQATS